MPDFILGVVAAFFGSTGFFSVVLAILNRKWKKADEKQISPQVIEELVEKVNKILDAKLLEKTDIMLRAQKVITKDRIKYLGTCYVYAGKLDIEEKTTIHEMYDAYKELGGNGDLTVIMDEVDKLRVEKKTGDKKEDTNATHKRGGAKSNQELRGVPVNGV